MKGNDKDIPGFPNWMRTDVGHNNIELADRMSLRRFLHIVFISFFISIANPSIFFLYLLLDLQCQYKLNFYADVHSLLSVVSWYKHLIDDCLFFVAHVASNRSSLGAV